MEHNSGKAEEQSYKNNSLQGMDDLLGDGMYKVGARVGGSVPQAIFVAIEELVLMKMGWTIAGIDKLDIVVDVDSGKNNEICSQDKVSEPDNFIQSRKKRVNKNGIQPNPYSLHKHTTITMFEGIYNIEIVLLNPPWHLLS
ncbi:hypothetical protein ACJX0J_015412, partial [Zea mays]